jgi:hypothetical protein
LRDDKWQFVREVLSAGVRSGSVAFTAHGLRTVIAICDSFGATCRPDLTRTGD